MSKHMGLVRATTVVVACFYFGSASAATYYVATNGNDSLNDGLSLGAPFKTIQQAASEMAPGDTCFIRGGTYRETVTPAVSGWSSAPITFTNYNGESVLISGLDRVTDSWSVDSGGVYKASVSLAMGSMNQVFVEDAMAYEARWPNNTNSLTYFTTARPTSSGSQSANGNINYLTNNDFPFSSSTDLDGASLWISPGLQWNNYVQPVRSYSPSSKTIGYDAPRPGSTQWTAQTDDLFYLFGTRALLDTDNEWWYDESAGELYLQAPGGVNPETLSVEVKARELGFNLDNRNNIIIGGLNLKGCRISAKLSNGIKLRRLTCHYVAHDAAERAKGIYLRGSNNEVTDCEIAFSSAALLNLELSSNGRLINNYVHDGGYMFTHRMFKAMGDGHIVSHNTISDSPGTLVRLEMEGGVFQYNHVFNGCWAQRDCGLMYNNYTDGQNTVIQYNVFHDNFSESENQSHAVYFDAGTSGYIIQRNIFYSNLMNGLKLNSSFHHLVYNNTFFNTSRYAVRYSRLGFIPSLDSDRPDGSEIVNNLATCANQTEDSGEPVERNPYSFRNLDPLVDDPLYVDESQHNFQLTAQSPARDRGIAISGVTEGFEGMAPDIGALEYGEAMFKTGHDFASPPASQLLVLPDLSLLKNRNRVENGSFEYGQSPWIKGGAQTMALHNESSTYENSFSRNGFYSARLGPAVDSIAQTVSGLEPGMRYVATAWAKAEPGETAVFRITGHGGSAISESTSSTNWTALDIWFTNTSSTATLTLEKSNTSASGYVFMDLCALKQSPAPNLPIQQDREFNSVSLITITNAADYAVVDSSITYQLTEAPAGASIGSDGLIAWQPDSGDLPGTYRFTTVAQDAGIDALATSNTFLVQLAAQVSSYDGFVAGTDNSAGEYIANPGTQTDGRYRLTDGQNPTTPGFLQSWAHATGSFEMGSTPEESLAYSDGSYALTNSGHAVFRAYTGQSTRALDVAGLGLGNSGTVRYFSFMMKLDNAASEARIDFGEAPFLDWGQLGIRAENGQFNARFAGQSAVSMGATDTNTHFFVWKVDFGNSEKAELYMDPVLSSEASNTPVLVATVSAGTYAPTHITLSKRSGTDGDKVTFDEIRIGESWDDVVLLEDVEPIAEPDEDLLSYDGFVAGDSNAEGEYINNPGTETDGRYRLASGQNPTMVGFSGSWIHETGKFEMGNTPGASLSYSDGTDSVSTSGNSVFRGYTGKASRELDNSVLGLGEPGNIRYISFMLKLDNLASEARVDFGEAAFQDWGQLAIRVEGGLFNARFAAQTAVTMGTADTDTHFFVWKVDFGASDKAWLFMDPQLGSEESNTPVLVGDVSSGTYLPTHVTLTKRSGTDGDAITFDELRIGKTWAAVTTVAPSSSSPTPYEQWAQSYNLSGNNAEYSADPDEDRYSNLYEWGLGGDPTNSLKHGIAPTHEITLTGGTNWFMYVYPSNGVADDLVYYLETNTELTDALGWTNDHYYVSGLSSASNGVSYVTNRISTEVESKQFIRLIIEEKL